MWGVEICKIYSKIMKKYHHCVKFTYPLSFQTRIPKVDQHTGGKWLIHGTKHRKDNVIFFFQLNAKYGTNLSEIWYIRSAIYFHISRIPVIGMRFRIPKATKPTTTNATHHHHPTYHPPEKYGEMNHSNIPTALNITTRESTNNTRFTA